MFASYKKNALIGRVLSGDAGIEGRRRRGFIMRAGTPGTQGSPLEERGNAGREPVSKGTIQTRIDNVSSE